MSSYIKAIDFLSYKGRFTFNSKGETRLKTTIGGIISLLAIITSFGFALYYLIEWLSRKNKTIISSRSANHTILFDNFHLVPLLIRLTDHYNQPYQHPSNLYEIHLDYWYKEINDGTQQIDQKRHSISIEQCDINKHFGNYKELFSTIKDLNTFYCAVPRKNNETLYGLYGDNRGFSYYQFYISFCMDKPFCVKNEIIEKQLEHSYLEFRTVDYIINIKNTDVVSYPEIRTDRHMISHTVYKRIWMYLNWIDYISDDGLFMHKYSQNNFFQFDSFRYDVDHRDISSDDNYPNTFSSLTILSTGNVVNYTRRLEKIHEYIAFISGIFKLIKVIADILNYYMGYNMYYLTLINDSFLSDPQIQVANKKEIKKTTKNNNNIIDNTKTYSTPNVIYDGSVSFRKKSNPKTNVQSLFEIQGTKTVNVKANEIEQKEIKVKVTCWQVFFPFRLSVRKESERNFLKTRSVLINNNLRIEKYLRYINWLTHLKMKIITDSHTVKDYMEEKNNYLKHIINRTTVGFINERNSSKNSLTIQGITRLSGIANKEKGKFNNIGGTTVMNNTNDCLINHLYNHNIQGFNGNNLAETSFN